MAFMKVLEFDGITLPFPDDYNVNFADVEADSSGETEAGTKQRDIVRQGVPTISVSFSVTRSGWKNYLISGADQRLLSDIFPRKL